MNRRLSPRKFFVPTTGIVLGGLLVVMLSYTGFRAVAQDQEPPPTPIPTPEEAARLKGLREKPVAAGRNKMSLIEEVLDDRAAKPEQQPGGPMECSVCHLCENPTEEKPCLRTCPRGVAEAIAAAAHEALPDDVILLHAFDWEDRRFMPVPFNHKLHADMAGIAGGCQICHHHTAEGKMHPRCRTCHEPVFAKNGQAQMRIPSLKGAYHRQCMGCHRDWSHSTKCDICHLPKSSGDEPTAADAEKVRDLLTHDDVAAHPAIENPEHIVQKTDYEHGPYVIFRHQEHVERYGYDCEHCHKGQSCARCHETESGAAPLTPEATTSRARHDACFPCHEDDACERCHSKTERAEPKYFDHMEAGFPLTKYHSALTCRACHRRLFFTRKLEGDCRFCHQGWSPETFNHAVTGQVLDENHKEIDCGDCHPGGDYAKPPACVECHDEDGGPAFPEKRPGPVVGAGPTAPSR